jgi:DNA-binding transcriptional MerR regulator
MGYTVKEVSEKTNLKPHVLRYYENEGLLPHIGRTSGGVRHYTDEDLEWISLICCLKNTGMSIKQIRDFVNLSLQGPQTLPQRCELLKAHREDVTVKIRQMQRHLEIVTCKIGYFSKQYEDYLTCKKS